MPSLKSNLLIVLIAGVIQTIAGALNAFIVPKFIGVEQFGFYREFLLYAGYIGFLHFGYVDGIMVKYAGNLLESLDKNEVESEFAFLFWFQSIVSIILVFVGIYLSSFSLIFFGISIFVNNVYQHLSIIFLATGKMRLYSLSRIFPVCLFLMNCVLVLFKITDYRYYIVTFLLSNILMLILFGKIFNNYFNLNILARYDFIKIKSIFETGIIVMLGNFLSGLFFSIDRWVVYFYFDNKNFAYYTFALSLMQIIQVLVTSISVTFYPYLAKEENREKILKYTKCLIIMSSFALILYFPLSEIVVLFLNKFIYSLDVLKILFLSVPALILSNSIAINLLKKKERINSYFLQFTFFLLIGIVTNFICFKIYESMLLIAAINVFLYYAFLFFVTYQVDVAKLEIKDIFYVIANLTCFAFSVSYLDLYIGMLCYVSSTLTLSYLFYRSLMSELSEMIFLKFIKPKSVIEG